MTFARNAAQAGPSPTCSTGGPVCANLCGLPEAPIDLRGNEPGLWRDEKSLR